MSLEGHTKAEILAGGRRLRLPGIGRPMLRRLFACLDTHRLTIVTPSGERITHHAAAEGPEAVLVFHTWRALRRTVSGGDIGFAKAYIAGEWSSPDLTTLISLAAERCDYLGTAVLGWLPLRVLNRLLHRLRSNTKSRSPKNIAFHYDLGNDFYRLWLDRSMTYSSAFYESPEQSLEDAQQAKQARIVDLLELEGGEKVLEIGFGWGSLAARMARRGARVTGLTLSEQQLAYAQDLVAAEGCADRVDLRLQDYRDSDGSFERIVSIEMLEAVGEAYWPAYFATLRDRLKPGGKAVLQAITIREDRFESYRRSADFIQRYIFPGGLLPTKTIIAEQAKCAGLALSSVTPFGDSYARTLAEWRCRFLEVWPAIEQLGFRPSFRRLWEYYLAYCEAGFRTGAISVDLYALTG
ncbi:MAG TPA: cyclopropane-fatty-acyl-phospholipid synthase family protein [Stellaceae bacterium]|nr:cyclopropane-fatty-acyl-phospholipid synthase family protein [Stellaceae bacterium]